MSRTRRRQTQTVGFSAVALGTPRPVAVRFGLRRSRRSRSEKSRSSGEPGSSRWRRAPSGRPTAASRRTGCSKCGYLGSRCSAIAALSLRTARGFATSPRHRWVPQAILTNPQLQWRQLDERAVEVRTTVGHQLPARLAASGQSCRSSLALHPAPMPNTSDGRSTKAHQRRVLRTRRVSTASRSARWQRGSGAYQEPFGARTQARARAAHRRR